MAILFLMSFHQLAAQQPIIYVARRLYLDPRSGEQIKDHNPGKAYSDNFLNLLV